MSVFEPIVSGLGAVSAAATVRRDGPIAAGRQYRRRFRARTGVAQQRLGPWLLASKFAAAVVVLAFLATTQRRVGRELSGQPWIMAVEPPAWGSGGNEAHRPTFRSLAEATAEAPTP